MKSKLEKKLIFFEIYFFKLKFLNVYKLFFIRLILNNKFHLAKFFIYLFIYC